MTLWSFYVVLVLSVCFVLRSCSASILRHCIVLSFYLVCSNRRHGWFLSLRECFTAAKPLGVTPVYVAEDGKCMFRACLASLSRTIDESSTAQLISSCETFLKTSGRSDVDLRDVLSAFPDEPLVYTNDSILDVMPVVLSKVLNVWIKICTATHVHPVVNTQLLPDTDATTIVLFRVVNPLTNPPVEHYFGSRVLVEGEDPSLPPQCECLSSDPSSCEYATLKCDDEYSVARLDYFGIEDHAKLGFEFATLYAHVLVAHPIDIYSGDVNGSGSGLAVPVICQRNGAVYYRRAGNSELVSVGQNWQLAVFVEAGFQYRADQWDRGELLQSADSNYVDSYNNCALQSRERVKRAVEENESLLALTLKVHGAESFQHSGQQGSHEEDDDEEDESDREAQVPEDEAEEDAEDLSSPAPGGGEVSHKDNPTILLMFICVSFGCSVFSDNTA